MYTWKRVLVILILLSTNGCYMRPPWFYQAQMMSGCSSFSPTPCNAGVSPESPCDMVRALKCKRDDIGCNREKGRYEGLCEAYEELADASKEEARQKAYDSRMGLPEKE